MRIAYISYECPPDSAAGGIATYIQQVARVMAGRGHEVEVFAASSTRSGLVKEADGVGYNWVQNSNRTEFKHRVVEDFSLRHQERPFEVMEAPEYYCDTEIVAETFPEIPLVVKMHTPSAELCRINLPRNLRSRLFWSARLLKGTVLSLGKGIRSPLQGQTGWIRSLTEWRTEEGAYTRKATLVASPCLDLCKYAENNWGIDRNRIRWVPNVYVPNMEFLNLRAQVQNPVVGYVGRLEHRKGVEDLAKAIPLVASQNPEVTFVFVGAISKHPVTGEPYDQWIRNVAGPYADRVECPGKVPLDEIAQVYGSFSVCALPSIWENFPNTCLEAMSAGRAVVATWTGGMSEMLENGRHGVLVPPHNPTALAKAIQDLLENDDERVRFGNSARKRILDAYNKDVIGKMTEELFAEAIHRHAFKSA